MARNGYSEEIKAQVLAALLTGQSVSSVSREYKIPKATVSSWKSRDPLGVAKHATQKEDDGLEIAGLLQSYLKENIKALIAQTKLFSNPEWLKEQDAPGVAVLHGVMTDKAVRLMEAFGANDTNDNQAEN